MLGEFKPVLARLVEVGSD